MLRNVILVSQAQCHIFSCLDQTHVLGFRVDYINSVDLCFLTGFLYLTCSCLSEPFFSRQKVSYLQAPTALLLHSAGVIFIWGYNTRKV